MHALEPVAEQTTLRPEKNSWLKKVFRSRANASSEKFNSRRGSFRWRTRRLENYITMILIPPPPHELFLGCLFATRWRDGEWVPRVALHIVSFDAELVFTWRLQVVTQIFLEDLLRVSMDTHRKSHHGVLWLCRNLFMSKAKPFDSAWTKEKDGYHAQCIPDEGGNNMILHQGIFTSGVDMKNWISRSNYGKHGSLVCHEDAMMNFSGGETFTFP